MNRLLDVLHTDHANLSQVLAVLEREIDALEAGRDSGLETLIDIGAYCQDYPGLSHHPAEEAIGHRLMEVAPEVGRAIGDIDSEHQSLESATRRYVETVTALNAGGAVLSREQVVEELRHFARLYRRHIEWEEAELFPAAEQCLGEAEWDRLNRSVAPRLDPLFDAEARASYQSIRESLLNPR